LASCWRKSESAGIISMNFISTWRRGGEEERRREERRPRMV